MAIADIKVESDSLQMTEVVYAGRKAVWAVKINTGFVTLANGIKHDAPVYIMSYQSFATQSLSEFQFHTEDNRDSTSPHC